MEQLSPRGQPLHPVGACSPTVWSPLSCMALWRCAWGCISSAQPLQPRDMFVTAVVPPFVTAIRCGTQQGQLAGAARRSPGHIKHAVETAA